jgi:hypothetical protein
MPPVIIQGPVLVQQLIHLIEAGQIPGAFLGQHLRGIAERRRVRHLQAARFGAQDGGLRGEQPPPVEEIAEFIAVHIA